MIFDAWPVHILQLGSALPKKKKKKKKVDQASLHAAPMSE